MTFHASARSRFAAAMEMSVQDTPPPAISYSPTIPAAPAYCDFCGKVREDWRWYGSRVLCWWCEEAD